MKNSSKILTAVAIGIVAGGVLGLLFAPDKGDETRKKIAKKSDKMLKDLKSGFGKEKLARVKEKLMSKLQKVEAKMDENSKEPASQV